MPIRVTSRKQLTNARVGELSVQATSVRPIGDADWHEFISNFRSEQSEAGCVPKAILQYSRLVSPSIAQRRELKLAERSVGEYEPVRRIALVTDSTLASGAMTAILWLMGGVKTSFKRFNQSEVDSALRWLAQVASFPLDEAYRVLSESAKMLGYPPFAVR